MKTSLRSLAAMFAGLLTLFTLLIAVEFFSAVVHPFPADFKGTAPEICAHVERYPAWVLATIVPLWAAVAFVSIATTRRVGNFFSAAIMGGFLLVALVYNLSMLLYPLWFKMANLIVLPLAVFVGCRRVIRRTITVATDGH